MTYESGEGLEKMREERYRRRAEINRLRKEKEAEEQALFEASNEDARFERYIFTKLLEMRPYEPGEVLSDAVSITAADRLKGCPKEGDMIARNSADHDEQWLVEAHYFQTNFVKKYELPLYG